MADQNATGALVGRRWSREAIADRRHQVFEMVLMKGISATAFAEQAGVSRQTICADVKALRQSVRREVKDLDFLAEVGDLKARFEKMAELALVEAAMTKTPAAKATLMGQALRAMELKTRMLIDVGFFPNAEKKVSGSLTLSGGLAVTKMTTGELKAMRERLAIRLADVLRRPGA